MDNEKDQKKVIKALLKKAVGYTTNESTMEYLVNEDNITLCKKKVTKKYIPPDINALKVFIEMNNVDFKEDLKDMTDKELDKEKKRLLDLLNDYNEKTKKENNDEN